uniref:Uncharacterized protein n=2 Tax=Meloidogyne TaxID=189290 RepID=A0A6V7VM58_MELEN|nr:unnamed protein product [Meloidogyne enterolobii]
MSERMSPQKYFEFLNNSRLLPYGVNYYGTNEGLTEVAINTLNKTDTFSKEELFLLSTHFEYPTPTDLERNIFIVWNLIKLIQHLIRLFIKFHGQNKNYYNDMLRNFYEKDKNTRKNVVSTLVYVYRFNDLEKLSEKLMGISKEGNNYLLPLLQDESNEYPTKISLDSEIQVEEFLPLLYKTYTHNEEMNKRDCYTINDALNKFTFENFTRLYIKLNNNTQTTKILLEKLKIIIVNILLADESKQQYLFSGFHQNILLYDPDNETFKLHQLILDNLKEMCRRYGDTSTWGYKHDYGQGSASGASGRDYGYLTDYVNQQISSHQQGSGYHGEEDMDISD